MTVQQQDPDVVRWGLHLIDVCSVTDSSVSPQTVACYEEDFSRIDSAKEHFSHPTHSTEENDEVIAQTLQEELSNLHAAEALGISSPEEDQKASIPEENDSNSECTTNNKGEAGKDEAIVTEVERLSNEMEESDLVPEMECESALDGELGKRLNQMVPVPHVPKINGEITSVDEATSDRERLSNRLKLYDLVERKITGDGNCQFSSLSDQIYGTPGHHRLVREQVVDQLMSRAELYKNHVPMAYGEYVEKMSKNGEWGDHVTLQAAADWFGIKIFILTSFKDTCYIEILPQTQKSGRTIFLSYWAKVHYNSIYPLGELPTAESKKKKWWWW